MSRSPFLCTGNDYRSRFTEEYLNHAAQREVLRWRADANRRRPSPGSRGTWMRWPRS